MSWGIFPLFFAAFGLGVERIGILKAVYPVTWGFLQVATGPLSDRWGRKGLIVAGMWVQAAGCSLPPPHVTSAGGSSRSLLLGLGTAMVYPSLIAAVSDASHPVLAGPLAQRLSLLARSRLCDRRALGRHYRRSLRPFLGNRIDCRADFPFWSGRGCRDAGANSGQGWLMIESQTWRPPILAQKNYQTPSAFTPESLLREACRQRALVNGSVPEICILEPDGDLVRCLREDGRCTRDPTWACYHTELYRFKEAGIEFGVIGCAVGSSFGFSLYERFQIGSVFSSPRSRIFSVSD